MKISTLRSPITCSFSFKNLPTAFAACFLLMLFLCLGAGEGWGQINISGGATITQNFTIGTSATASLPTGWKVDAISTARTLGTYSGAVSATVLSVGANMSGSATSGIYNYGAGTDNTGTDRAVGG